MTLAEMSLEYRKTGEVCRARLEQLNDRLAHEKMGEMERLRLRRKANMLSTMAHDALAISRYLENYYGDDDNAGKKDEYVC